MNKYQIKVIDSMASFEALSESWNDLLAHSRADTIFLTWEWLFTWAEIYLGEEDKLFILTVYDGDMLMGIAPWYIRKTARPVTVRQLEFLGTGESSSDYLDVIMKAGSEKKGASCIFEYLRGEGRSYWDILYLDDIPASSLFALFFIARVEESGAYCEVRPSSYCPRAQLGTFNNDFLSPLSAKQRQNHTREVKKLMGDGSIQKLTLSGNAVHDNIENFLCFYQEQKKMKQGRFSAFIKVFSQRVAGYGWVQLDMLVSAERMLAGLYHLRYKNSLMLYLMATDKTYNPKVSIGNIMVGFCIESSLIRNDNIYDFLKGVEDYKFRWANDGILSFTLVLYQRRPVALFQAMKTFVKYTAKIVVR